MTLREIECFLAVCRRLNFTRAAEELCISQTAVTRQVQMLEQELGVRLLERGGRGVTLTEAGEFFLPEARRVWRSAHLAEENVRDWKSGESGSLAVGWLSGFDPVQLTRVIGDFRLQYPKVELGFRVGEDLELLHLLDTGELDCVMAYPHPERTDLTAVVIRTYPLVAALPAAALNDGLASVSRADLGTPLYDCSMPGPARDHTPLEEALLRAACGEGYAVVPSYVADGAYGQLLTFLPLAPAETGQLVLAYDAVNHHRLVLERFVTYFKGKWYG